MNYVHIALMVVFGGIACYGLVREFIDMRSGEDRRR